MSGSRRHRLVVVILAFTLTIAALADSQPTSAMTPTAYRCPGGGLFDARGQSLNSQVSGSPVEVVPAPEAIKSTTSVTILPWSPRDYPACRVEH